MVLSTSSSERLSDLGLRCALFFAPLAAMLALSTFALYFTGELTRPADAVKLQASSPALYYPLYQPKSVYPNYKLAGASRRHSEVLVLGASRGFSVRREFVSVPEDLFYNAAMIGVGVLGIMREFLDRLPQDRLPHVVLLVMDPWWFRKDAPVQPEPDPFEVASPIAVLDFAWRNGLYLATRRGTFSSQPDLIGVDARRQTSGLRPDGSFLAGQRWLDTVPNLLQNQLSGIRNEEGPFFIPGPPDLSREAMEEMERFLTYCSRHGIAVIGYFSPFHPALFDAVRKERRLEYYQRVAPALAPLFHRYGAVLFNFQDPDSIGCTSGEFLDVFHESEVCAIRDLIAISSREEKARSILDVKKLEGFLNRRISAWQLGF
jgi:hypothetical protein